MVKTIQEVEGHVAELDQFKDFARSGPIQEILDEMREDRI
jgi:hypothetical protein